jgi:hypothetical protein
MICEDVLFYPQRDCPAALDATFFSVINETSPVFATSNHAFYLFLSTPSVIHILSILYYSAPI